MALVPCLEPFASVNLPARPLLRPRVAAWTANHNVRALKAQVSRLAHVLKVAQVQESVGMLRIEAGNLFRRSPANLTFRSTFLDDSFAKEPPAMPAKTSGFGAFPSHPILIASLTGEIVSHSLPLVPSLVD